MVRKLIQHLKFLGVKTLKGEATLKFGTKETKRERKLTNFRAFFISSCMSSLSKASNWFVSSMDCKNSWQILALLLVTGPLDHWFCCCCCGTWWIVEIWRKAVLICTFSWPVIWKSSETKVQEWLIFVKFKFFSIKINSFPRKVYQGIRRSNPSHLTKLNLINGQKERERGRENESLIRSNELLFFRRRHLLHPLTWAMMNGQGLHSQHLKKMKMLHVVRMRMLS